MRWHRPSNVMAAEYCSISRESITPVQMVPGFFQQRSNHYPVYLIPNENQTYRPEFTKVESAPANRHVLTSSGIFRGDWTFDSLLARVGAGYLNALQTVASAMRGDWALIG
jgi:hypothetical protein